VNFFFFLPVVCYSTARLNPSVEALTELSIGVTLGFYFIS